MTDGETFDRGDTLMILGGLQIDLSRGCRVGRVLHRVIGQRQRGTIRVVELRRINAERSDPFFKCREGRW